VCVRVYVCAAIYYDIRSKKRIAYATGFPSNADVSDRRYVRSRVQSTIHVACNHMCVRMHVCMQALVCELQAKVEEQAAIIQRLQQALDAALAMQ
jgi:hypothetical protein